MKLSLHTTKIKDWMDYLLYTLLLLYIGVSPIWYMFNVGGFVPFINFTYAIAVGLVIILSYNLVYTFNSMKVRISSFAYLLGLFVIVYIIIIQVISYPILIEFGSAESILYRSTFVRTGVLSVFFWLVGSNIITIYQLLQRPPWRFLTLVVYLGYIFAIVFLIVKQKAGIPQDIVSFQLNTKIFQNYFYISDNFVLLSMIVICLVFRNSTSRWLFFGISMLILYASLSRTSFYLFILAMLFFLVISSLNYRSMLLIAVAFLYLGFINISSLIQDYGGNRIINLVTDFSSDTSYIARQNLFRLGLQELKENWLLGMFMAEMKSGRYGGYIHNYLSFWVAYGIVPFAAFVISALYSFVTLIKHYVIDRHHPLIGFVTCYSIFCYLAIILSRSYVWPYVWLAFSAALQIISDVNTDRLMKNKD